MLEKKYIVLRTNVALFGTVSTAYYAHNQKAKDEGWAPKLKLVGQWEGESKTDVYVPLGLQAEMEKKGFLSVELDPGPTSEPRFTVMMPNTQIKLLREEEGTKKLTHFSLVGGVAGLGKPTQAPQDAPEEQEPERESTAPTLRDLMAEIETKYAACLNMSAYQHVNLYAAETIHLDMRSVQAGAATMMIEMSRHGIKPTPAMVTALQKRLEAASLKVKTTDPVEAP